MENNNLLNYNIIDDLAISEYFLNKEKTPMIRYDICNNFKKKNLELYYNEIITNNHYHVRIKTQNRSEFDIITFKYLIEKIYDNFNE